MMIHLKRLPPDWAEGLLFPNTTDQGDLPSDGD